MYRCFILNCSLFPYRERLFQHFLLDLSWARRVQTLVCVRCVSTDKRLRVALVCVSACPFASRLHCKSRNGLHSTKLFNKCCCWVEFARREQHTLHRFLDDTKAKKKKVHGFSLYQKQYNSCYLLLLHSGMKTDKITDSTSETSLIHLDTHTRAHTHTLRDSFARSNQTLVTLHANKEQNNTTKKITK